MSATSSSRIFDIHPTEDLGNEVNSAGKHPAFWMSDGTIVLAAQSTQQRHNVLFKVHKSILAKHSVVFRDMFDMPDSADPEELQETCEGAPLVEVQDSAEDWTDLLRFLYGDLSGLSFKMFDPDLEMSIFGVMRLVKKYDLEHLRNTLASRVEAQWPQSLVEWSVYKDYTKRHTAHPLICDARILEPAAAIRLATEHDIPRILPAAFYSLSCLDIDDDWETRKDRMKRTGRSLLPSARWHLLNPSDYSRLVRGKKELNKVGRDYFKKLSTGTLCTTPNCRMQWRDNVASAVDAIFAAQDRQDILEVLDTHMKTEYWKTLCTLCRSKVQKQARDTRENIWQRLPEFFGLGDIPEWTPPKPVSTHPAFAESLSFYQNMQNLMSLPPFPPGPLTLDLQSGIPMHLHPS